MKGCYPWLAHPASTVLRLTAVLVAVVALIRGPCAQACYSGLVVIPTADLIAPGEWGVEGQLDGVFWEQLDHVRIINTEIGLTDRLEAGLDMDLSEGTETRMLFNAKYLLLPDTDRTPAVAAGIFNVGDDLRAAPYLVVTDSFGPLRGHAGVASIEGTSRWFVGADHAVNERLTLMADYTSGSENAASVGCNYQVTDRFGVMAGVLLPNASGKSTGFSVHFVFSGALRHTGKGE